MKNENHIQPLTSNSSVNAGAELKVSIILFVCLFFISFPFPPSFTNIFSLPEEVSCSVSQIVLEFMVLCLNLLSAGIPDMHDHTYLVQMSNRNFH